MLTCVIDTDKSRNVLKVLLLLLLNFSLSVIPWDLNVMLLLSHYSAGKGEVQRVGHQLVSEEQPSEPEQV